MTTTSTYWEDSSAITNIEESRINSKLPFFELSTIAKATNNFASNNKLGMGGFGSVYEVRSCPQIMSQIIFSHLHSKSFILLFFSFTHPCSVNRMKKSCRERKRIKNGERARFREREREILDRKSESLLMVSEKIQGSYP